MLLLFFLWLKEVIMFDYGYVIFAVAPVIVSVTIALIFAICPENPEKK